MLIHTCTLYDACLSFHSVQATVTKKMMYYNMRVRTTRRKLAETHFSLTERKRTLLQLPEECVRTLSHTLKNVGSICF